MGWAERKGMPGSVGLDGLGGGGVSPCNLWWPTQQHLGLGGESHVQTHTHRMTEMLLPQAVFQFRPL